MIKNELRAFMREKRRALTDAEVRQKSAAIENYVLSLDIIKNADAVCTFLSAFKEPDTTGIIRCLSRWGKKIIVPVTDIENTTLDLSYIDNLTDLKKGAYGISEPVKIRNAKIRDIDALIIPGLAFGKNGARMGFGKGYYDRLLKNTDAVKIALCYEFQLLDKIPEEPHDIQMDMIITEDKIYAF